MRRGPKGRFAVALLVVMAGGLGAACGDTGSDAPGPDVQEFAVVPGSWDLDERVFEPLVDGGPVDVVLGFQGLVFINLALMAPREIPARFVARGEVVFEDFDERYPFYDNQVLFEPLDDDWRMVPSFRVPFGLPASELIGRTVRLDIEFTSHDDAWRAHAAFRVLLTDSGCVHTPEGEFVCGQ